MPRTSLFIETHLAQVSKKPDRACGDTCLIDRAKEVTTIIVADGIGSGGRAHIYATMCANRLMELLKQGFSAHESFERVVASMHEARKNDGPYAVFTLLRIRKKGEISILSYEMPETLFIGLNSHAGVLPRRALTMAGEVVYESNCFLDPSESIMLASDGVSQAGLGTTHRIGLTMKGAAEIVNDFLREGAEIREIPQMLLRYVREINGGTNGDDITILMAKARPGTVLNILTGPPADRDQDGAAVRDFMSREGFKAICGSTTADIVSRETGLPIKMEENPKSLIAPPCYFMEGINLVTEGAVTLNQVFNIIDKDPSLYRLDTGVTQLCYYMLLADRINIILGGAENVAHEDISFIQRGITPRHSIIRMVAEKLRILGKLVVMEEPGGKNNR